MSTVRNLNCYLEYDEGVMEIVIIDAVIELGIHAFGSMLDLSLENDGVNLLIKCRPTKRAPDACPYCAGKGEFVSVIGKALRCNHCAGTGQRR